MKTSTLIASILFGYFIIQSIILLLFFHFHNSSKKETMDTMDKIKITGTKSYVDIERDGTIARFDGELCSDDFYANASSI